MNSSAKQFRPSASERSKQSTVTDLGSETYDRSRAEHEIGAAATCHAHKQRAQPDIGTSVQKESVVWKQLPRRWFGEKLKRSFEGSARCWLKTLVQLRRNSLCAAGLICMRLMWWPIVLSLTYVLHATQVMAQPIGWTTFTNHRGTSVELPADVFSVARGTERGRTFVTPDGRAALDVYAGPNDRGETPAQLLRRTVPQSRSRLTYTRVASNFFAISAPHEGRILYRRCNFDARMIHCIDLTYPLEEKRAWDETVTRISRSLRPL